MNLNLILMLSAMLASLTGAVSGERATAAGASKGVQAVSVAAGLAKQVQAIATHNVPVLSGFGGDFTTKAAAMAPQSAHASAPAINILVHFAQRRE